MSHYVIHVGIIDREIMENLAEIYRKNEYTFTDTNRVSFTIETIPQGVYKTPWAIITAWNPNNEELLKKQNDAQNLELKHALHVSGLLLEKRQRHEVYELIFVHLKEQYFFQRLKHRR